MTPAAPPAKAGVGKNTIMMMLSQERSKTSQVWLGAIAAVLAFVIVGGGALYWRMRQESDAQAKVIAAQQANFTTQQNAVAEKVGMTAGEIAKKYGNGTVYVAMHWRLYDGGTGKAVFHKTVDWEKERLRAYVRLPRATSCSGSRFRTKTRRTAKLAGRAPAAAS